MSERIIEDVIGGTVQVQLHIKAVYQVTLYHAEKLLAIMG